MDQRGRPPRRDDGVGRGRARRSAASRRCPAHPGKDPWQATETRLPATAGDGAHHRGPLGSWLLEPDPAIIRGHLLAELCDLTGGHLVSDGIAYVTGTGDCHGSWGGRTSRWRQFSRPAAVTAGTALRGETGYSGRATSRN